MLRWHVQGNPGHPARRPHNERHDRGQPGGGQGQQAGPHFANCRRRLFITLHGCKSSQRISMQQKLSLNQE
jgi:hypothetical protein